MKPGDLYRCNELTAQSEAETLFKVVAMLKSEDTGASDHVSYVTFGSDESPTTRPVSEFEQLFTLVSDFDA